MTTIDQTDIAVIAWWIIILVLGFATIGLYTVFQILRTVWAKPKPPQDWPDEWPKGRMCMVLRIPNMGTPAIGGKMGEPAKGGRMAVEFKITDEHGRVWQVHEKVVGYSEGPYVRLYSQEMAGSSESSTETLT